MHCGVFSFRFFYVGLFKNSREKKGWKKFGHFIYGRSVLIAATNSGEKVFFFFRYQHMFLDPKMTFIAKCYHFVYK